MFDRHQNTTTTTRKRQKKLEEIYGKIKRRPFELKVFTFIGKIVEKTMLQNAKIVKSTKGREEVEEEREKEEGITRECAAKVRVEYVKILSGLCNEKI